MPVPSHDLGLRPAGKRQQVPVCEQDGAAHVEHHGDQADAGKGLAEAPLRRRERILEPAAQCRLLEPGEGPGDVGHQQLESLDDFGIERVRRCAIGDDRAPCRVQVAERQRRDRAVSVPLGCRLPGRHQRRRGDVVHDDRPAGAHSLPGRATAAPGGIGPGVDRIEIAGVAVVADRDDPAGLRVLTSPTQAIANEPVATIVSLARRAMSAKDCPRAASWRATPATSLAKSPPTRELGLGLDQVSHVVGGGDVAGHLSGTVAHGTRIDIDPADRATRDRDRDASMPGHACSRPPP